MYEMFVNEMLVESLKRDDEVIIKFVAISFSGLLL